MNHLTKGRTPFTVEQKGKIAEEYLSPGKKEKEKKEKEKEASEEREKDTSERVLYICDNELLKGMIDKAQFGNYGIVHTVHELYGADTSGMLLSTFSRLFTLFLQVNLEISLDFFLIVGHSPVTSVVVPSVLLLPKSLTQIKSLYNGNSLVVYPFSLLLKCLCTIKAFSELLCPSLLCNICLAIGHN